VNEDYVTAYNSVLNSAWKNAQYQYIKPKLKKGTKATKTFPKCNNK